jgi:importin-9
VKGELIVNNDDGQIKTRSRAKQSMSTPLEDVPTTQSVLDRLYADYIQEDQVANDTTHETDPDQYTFIPSPLKIVKVLIEELVSASGARAAANAASMAVAAAQFDDDENDDEGWEDDDDTLDLSLGTTKADLMSFMEGGGQRQRDDETQGYLTDFFIRCGRENIANFQEWYGLLSEDEKHKLNEIANSAGQ